MIWLASYPRSGNTFFRIVLHEVYGIESREFRLEKTNKRDAAYRDFPVAKTHLLPHQLLPADPDIPAVYLVRDGRDALVSEAYHRHHITEPGSNFLRNLFWSIIAGGGSNFGGWGKHVKAWSERASVIIRFEELIRDPIREIEKIRDLIPLPEPQREKVPTFEDLRNKETPYATKNKKNYTKEQILEFKQKFFRKGKVGNWKDEMPVLFHYLFWLRHGSSMTAMGYTERKPVIF